ncbi:hypothetical protein J2Y67_004628 [Neobacillus niacini]|nr:hypothetical protein [Neobacillus niacini]
MPLILTTFLIAKTIKRDLSLILPWESKGQDMVMVFKFFNAEQLNGQKK